jgi:hypothetical protein
MPRSGIRRRGAPWRTGDHSSDSPAEGLVPPWLSDRRALAIVVLETSLNAIARGGPIEERKRSRSRPRMREGEQGSSRATTSDFG